MEANLSQLTTRCHSGLLGPNSIILIEEVLGHRFKILEERNRSYHVGRTQHYLPVPTDTATSRQNGWTGPVRWSSTKRVPITFGQSCVYALR